MNCKVFIKLSAFLLAAVMLFSGCGSITADAPADSSDGVISSEESSSEQVSSDTPSVPSSSSIVSSSSEAVSSSITSSTDKPTSSESSSFETPNAPEFKIPDIVESTKYGDLLSQIPDGKKVTMLGDLTDDKYMDAKSRLESILGGYGKTFSLVAYSLDNTKAVSYNAEAPLFPACTIKAFYTLYSCIEMDKGNGSLSTVKKYEQKHYEGGTGDMQYKPVGTDFDMKTIIGKSVTISDNVGYRMQVEFFGRDGYNAWVSSKGCPSLKISPTVWALKVKADEQAVMWREIYRYFKSNAEHSEFLFDITSTAGYNFAAKELSGVNFSHKSGFNRDARFDSMSDAGIVWKGDTPFIVVMVTNASGINESAQKTMNKVMNILYNELF